MVLVHAKEAVSQPKSGDAGLQHPLWPAAAAQQAPAVAADSMHVQHFLLRLRSSRTLTLEFATTPKHVRAALRAARAVRRPPLHDAR